MFRKWMTDASTVFFTAIQPDRTTAKSFYGTIVGISEDLVLIMGEGVRAEVDLQDAQFAFVTECDLPTEVRREVNSSFDSGIFISQTDRSMFAFLEIDEN